MKKHRSPHALRRRFGHAAVPRALRGAFESIASGTRAFVRHVTRGEVFFQLYNGAHGNMPKASFLRQYRKVRS